MQDEKALKQKNDMIRYYEETADCYDDWHTTETGRELDDIRYLNEFVLPNVQKQESILDIGTGTGFVAGFLSNASYENVYATDISIALLRQGLEKKRLSKESIFVADAYHLPIHDNSFEYVTVFGVLHHTVKWELIVNEAIRVAREGVFLRDAWGGMRGRISSILRRYPTLYKIIYFLLKRKLPKEIHYSKGDGPTVSFTLHNLLYQAKTEYGYSIKILEEHGDNALVLISVEE